MLFSAWNRDVSEATVAARCSDLRIFGSFAWRIGTPLRVAERIRNDLRDGGARFAALADAWDDEQHAAGISERTRTRRRANLRSFAAWCRMHGDAPRGSGLATIDREPPSGATHERAESAIVAALACSRVRDAAIVMLAWETGLTPGRIRDLRIADLATLAISDRCDRALRFVCGPRPSGAWVFPSRDHREPLSLATMHATIDRAGLPTPVALLAARAERLRVLACDPFDDVRTLAGEI